MTTTANLTKITTTRGWVLIGSIVDGYKVQNVAHNDDGHTALKLDGKWGEYLPSEWPISYYI